MFKKILAAIISLFGITMSSNPAYSEGGPYKDEAPNLIYNLLFCDNIDLFKENQKAPIVPPWSILFNNPPDLEELGKIATDKTQESRVRLLAFNILRKANKQVPKKELLGTIIEVRVPGGLDTLAVFSDGGARYINYTGKIAVIEGTPNDFENEIKQVIETSKPIVDAIGPWEKDRLPAPKGNNMRLTFLVSDGLYFGEGTMDAMQKDQMAGNLINAATALLLKIVNKTTDSEQGN